MDKRAILCVHCGEAIRYVPEDKEWKNQLKELAMEYIKDELNISVLPLSTIDSSWSHRQVPKKYQNQFTEAEGILKAVEYLKGKNFHPSDLHGENIMILSGLSENERIQPGSAARTRLFQNLHRPRKHPATPSET